MNFKKLTVILNTNKNKGIRIGSGIQKCRLTITKILKNKTQVKQKVRKEILREILGAIIIKT